MKDYATAVVWYNERGLTVTVQHAKVTSRNIARRSRSRHGRSMTWQRSHETTRSAPYNTGHASAAMQD